MTAANTSEPLFSLVTTAADIQATADLAHEIWHQHFTPIIGQAQVDYMVEKFQSVLPITRQIEEGADYYRVSLQEKSVAYFCLIPQPDTGKLMISKLYVKQTCRDLGLGKQALAFIENRARELGLKKLWLTVNRNNTDSIEWYKHRGFQTFDTMDKDIGNGFVMNDYLMEKSVS